MPAATIRSFEATSSGFESAEEIQFKSHKAKVVVQKLPFKGPVSPKHHPPPPPDIDSTDEQVPTTMEQRLISITRDVGLGLPGDQDMRADTQSAEQRQLAKKRSQYYEDAFAYREPVSSARERVSRETMIMADIKTNVIASDYILSM